MIINNINDATESKNSDIVVFACIYVVKEFFEATRGECVKKKKILPRAHVTPKIYLFLIFDFSKKKVFSVTKKKKK